MDEPERSGTLDGDVLDEVKLQAEIDEKKDEHMQAQLDRFKLICAFWSADYSGFLNLAKETGFDKDAYAKNSPGVFGIGPLAFQIAFSAIIMAQETSGIESKRYKALGGKYLSQIRGWVNKGNPNVVHFESILEAEMHVLMEENHRAETKFEVAILMSTSRGFINYEALTHERYAEFLLKQNETYKAKENFEKAVKLYEEWGAGVRASAVAARYRDKKVSVSAPVEVVGLGP